MSQRYKVAAMASLGFFVLFGTRCNLGMLKAHEETRYHEDQEWLDWDPSNHFGFSSFFSFLLTQIPGGILAYNYPATKVFGLSILCSSILNVLVLAVFGVQSVWIAFALQACAQGVTFPAVFGILRYWTPPLERGRMVAMVLCGGVAGMLLGVPICGLLTKFMHWTVMFIFFGVLGIIWFGFWYKLVTEKPKDHPTISEQELRHIEQSLEESVESQMPVSQWNKMLASLPVYSIVIASFCQCWGYFLLIFYQGKFLRHKFSFMINKGGLIAAMPYILLITSVLLSGFLADFLCRRKKLWTTNVRKVFICVSFVLQGLCFLYIPYSTHPLTAISVILLSIFISGFAVSGYVVNALDIAPNCASIIVGLSNTAGLLSGLICPIITDQIKSDIQNQGIWNTAFMIPTCLFIAAAIFYGLFSSGDSQPWTEARKRDQTSLNEVPDSNVQRNDKN